jgi:hypothetical protein
VDSIFRMFKRSVGNISPKVPCRPLRMRAWRYRPPDRPFFARVLRIGLLLGQQAGTGNQVAHTEVPAVGQPFVIVLPKASLSPC